MFKTNRKQKQRGKRSHNKNILFGGATGDDEAAGDTTTDATTGAAGGTMTDATTGAAGGTTTGATTGAADPTSGVDRRGSGDLGEDPAHQWPRYSGEWYGTTTLAPLDLFSESDSDSDDGDEGDVGGWKGYMDRLGNYYYYNAGTGQTTLNKLPESVAARDGGGGGGGGGGGPRDWAQLAIDEKRRLGRILVTVNQRYEPLEEEDFRFLRLAGAWIRNPVEIRGKIDIAIERETDRRDDAREVAMSIQAVNWEPEPEQEQQEQQEQ